MAHKIVPQKKFLKGVNAGTGILTEPPGTVTRISNLLFTQRGSLQTIPGTAVVSTIVSAENLIRSLGYFSNLTPGQFPYYSALAQRSTAQLGNVTGFSAAVVVGSGVNNPAGFYFFGIVATVSGGHSDITPTQFEVHSVVAFDGVNFTWSAVSGATGYAIYVYNFSGNPDVPPVSLVATVGAVTSLNFTGVIPFTPTIPPPTGNTTFLMQLFSGAVPSGGSLTFTAVTAGSFPSSSPLPATLAPGDPLFNSSPIEIGFSPYGGLSGALCPIPQILQFDQLAILILGNGFAPQVYDPSQGAGASVTALANTFTAAYPSWQATVAWTEGSQIAVVVGGTNYLFTATQGGVSGGSSPTFPATLGATVPDGQVIWTNGGKITTSIAPRGAAHGIIYSGSLWIANTSPQTTSDNLDGPTCLKMSDSNNPNSWNPVNTAFIGKDDGTQITGLATYTIAEVGIAPTGSLVVFKEFSTYQILGVFGATDFQITQAETDMGCIAARSVLFIPGYGIMRLTHLGFGIFNGVRDRLVSEEIRPYIFGGTGLDSDITGIDFTTVYLAQAAQVADPPMYVCACPLTSSSGSLIRVFAYDLVLKAWTIFDLPWSIGALTQARVGEGLPLLIAGLTDGSGNIERLFAGDVNWDSQSGGSNTPITWTFRTSHVYQEGSALRAFFRRVTIRGYASQSSAGKVQVSLLINGNPSSSYATYLQPQPNSAQFQLTIDIMATANIVAVQVTGTGPVTIDGLDWQVDPKPNMALVIG